MSLRALVWSLVVGAPLSARDAAEPAASGLDRAYHEAWQRWAVEGEVEEGHRRLRQLLRHPDAGTRWQVRIRLDLVRCDLLLGQEDEALEQLEWLRRRPGAERALAELLPLEAAVRAALAAVVVSAPPIEVEPEPPKAEEPRPRRDGPEASPTPDQPVSVTPRPVESVVPEVATHRIPESPAAGRMPDTSLPELLEHLDRRAQLWRDSLVANERRCRVAALVGRRYGGTLSQDSEAVYNAATYSFQYGTRDDRDRVHNDWSVQFGNSGNRLHVDMVTDDRSEIWDLGPVNFTELVVARPAVAGVPSILAHAGHVYLFHVLDSNTDLWAALQVLELHRGEWLIFRWRLLERPGR